MRYPRTRNSRNPLAPQVWKGREAIVVTDCSKELETWQRDCPPEAMTGEEPSHCQTVQKQRGGLGNQFPGHTLLLPSSLLSIPPTGQTQRLQGQRSWVVSCRDGLPEQRVVQRRTENGGLEGWEQVEIK